jgi:hypothetical protein
MLPIRDTVQSRSYPVVNTTIIAVNVLFYLVEMSQGANFEQFIVVYGLLPARYSVPEIAAHFSLGQQILPFFLSCSFTEASGTSLGICGLYTYLATMWKTGWALSGI